MEDLLINRDRLAQIRVPFDNLCRYLQAKQILGVYRVAQRGEKSEWTISTSLINKEGGNEIMERLLIRWPRQHPNLIDRSSQKLLNRPLVKGLSRKLKLTPLTAWDHYAASLPYTLHDWIAWFFEQTCYFQASWAREHDACLLNTETQQMVFAQHKQILSRTVEYLIKPEEPAPPARTVLPRPIRKVRK